VIKCVKILVNRFRGYGVLRPQNCYFPLTCCVALTTVYALPYYTVIADVIIHCLTVLEVSIVIECAIAV